MTETALWEYSLTDLSRAFHARELSPVAVTEAYLQRIEVLEPRLHAFTTLTADQAIRDAHAAEARLARDTSLGPLDGVPLALKDVFDTAGLRTTANSPLYAERVPEVDATVVARLRAGGMVLLGKLALYEFSLGVPELVGPFPAVRNPWNLDHVPGGSSSGSAAAVAAGLCAGSFGSDTGGSVRGPASYCGIVGFKPSAGLVSRFGVVPLAWTLDQVGPLAHSVEDVALLLQAVAGYDARDVASVRVPVPNYRAALGRSLKGLRIGAPVNFTVGHMDIHPETTRVYAEALEALRALGAIVEHCDLPEVIGLGTEIVSIIGSCETLAMLEPVMQRRPEKLGHSFVNVPLAGALYTAVDYIQALRGRTLICQALAEAMQTYDLLVLPTTSSPAPALAVEITRSGWRPTTLLRRLFNLTGQPAISVPAGFSSDGLPIGVQLAGRLFEDATVLAAAHAFIEATQWHHQRPQLGT
ncbi:MAG: amidase [Anaerolineales bacterium]|nr:amidase [Anaerolineales bacterium]